MLADWLIGTWSFHHLSDRDSKPWYEACEDRPGLYRLVALQCVGSITPAKLQRVCDIDDSGTLCIGASSCLPARVAELVRTHAFSKRGGHKTLPAALAQKYGPDRLAVAFCYTDEVRSVFDAEHELVSAYKSLFGETPPLNS